MTVRELLEVLSGMPEDAVVVMCQTYNDGWSEQEISAGIDCVRGADFGYVYLNGKSSYNDEDEEEED